MLLARNELKKPLFSRSTARDNAVLIALQSLRLVLLIDLFTYSMVRATPSRNFTLHCQVNEVHIPDFSPPLLSLALRELLLHRTSTPL